MASISLPRPRQREKPTNIVCNIPALGKIYEKMEKREKARPVHALLTRLYWSGSCRRFSNKITLVVYLAAIAKLEKFVSSQFRLFRSDEFMISCQGNHTF
jgi:hypothetical protein